MDCGTSDVVGPPDAAASILVVDDEQGILRSLRRVLKPLGHTVHVADNGEEALSILSREEVAVLICDQKMPGMTGPEVLERAYAVRPDAIRITLTGYADLNSMAASINKGRIHHFLLKPWDDDQLRRVVTDGVRSFQLRKDHARLVELTRQQKAQLEAWNQRLEVQVRDRTAELSQKNRSLEELQRRVEQSLRDTVSILASLLEAYSANLGIHSKRVAQTAREIAAKLDVSEHEARDIEFAAYLHDIGKLSRVYLSERERGLHKSGRWAGPVTHHPEVGYNLLSRVGGFERVALGVKHQHEWFNGAGRPDALNGERIPLASRIIAVANAYDKAVYPKHDPTRVMREAGERMLLEGKGKRFEPRLVHLLLDYISAVGGDGRSDEEAPEVEVSVEHLRPGMVLSRALHNTDGVLLLKAGTELTDELVERIRAMRHGNIVLSGVFVGGGSPSAAPPTSDTKTAERRPAPTPTTPRPDLVKGSSPPDEQATATEGAAEATPAEAGQVSGRPGGTRTRQSRRAATCPRQQLKILVVDDSILVCNALRRELRPLGVDVVASNDPWTALHLTEQDEFSVVIVDLMMPTMGGDEFVRRLDDIAPDLPCIILTGNATRDRVVQLVQERNVVRILTKPWDHARLVEAINEAVGGDQPALAASANRW